MSSLFSGVPRPFQGHYNRDKGITFWWLIDHRGIWFRAAEIAANTGLNLNSLLVLLPKWAGPGWHKLRRQKIRGYWCYTITPKGYYWFQRWHRMMPLAEWKRQIDQWQSDQRKLKETETTGGAWYQDEAGHWRFKSNT